MRPIYKFLEIENHQDISEEVYQYIITQTDALTSKHYFVSQPINHMLSHCPLLVEFLQTRQLVPRLLATIVCRTNEQLKIHRDNDGVDPYVRILWPIKNCQGSKTKIWQVPEGAGELISEPNGTLHTEYSEDQERELIDEFELVSPVLFDASCVHNVCPDPELAGHRISFTIGFDRDLPISKSIKAWFGFQR
jgi:hypothetical protein